MNQSKEILALIAELARAAAASDRRSTQGVVYTGGFPGNVAIGNLPRSAGR